MSNFYERYGCKNKEELYAKVINKDELVSDLIDFIEFSKSSIENKHRSLNSPSSFFDYAKYCEPPTINEVVLIYVDIKNQPVHHYRTKLGEKSDIKQSLKEGLEAGATFMFTIVNSKSDKSRVEDLKGFYNTVGIQTIDQLTFNDVTRQYRSELKMEVFDFNESFMKDREQDSNYNTSKIKVNDEEFIKFAQYYATNELIGNNVIHDFQVIKENLKVSYQFLDQEVFGYIGYDENNEVIVIKELFKGGRSSSIVDSRILIKELLSAKNIKGFAVFHNHPSGIPDPTPEDEAITLRLAKISDALGIEFLDHYIVGKKSVLSFAELVSSFQSQNNDYQRKIDNQKENNQIYEIQR